MDREKDKADVCRILKSGRGKDISFAMSEYFKKHLKGDIKAPVFENNFGDFGNFGNLIDLDSSPSAK